MIQGINEKMILKSIYTKSESAHSLCEIGLLRWTFLQMEGNVPRYLEVH
jgi:hypothetical protein